jgi:hypothetical protein
VLAWLLAATLLPVVAGSVSAECSNLAIDPIDRVNVGAAFFATVTEVSGQVDPNPDGSAWNIHVKMSVNAVYYGSVPKVLEFNDWAGFGCGEFRTELLHVGDRIIVAAQDVRLAYLPAPPFEGHMVVWKKVGNDWAFFEDALVFGSNPDFYPGAAREARTKADILDVIATWTLPETSTNPEVPVPHSNAASLWVAVALLLGFAVGMWRFRRTLT